MQKCLIIHTQIEGRLALLGGVYYFAFVYVFICSCIRVQKISEKNIEPINFISMRAFDPSDPGWGPRQETNSILKKKKISPRGKGGWRGRGLKFWPNDKR